MIFQFFVIKSSHLFRAKVTHVHGDVSSRRLGGWLMNLFAAGIKVDQNIFFILQQSCLTQIPDLLLVFFRYFKQISHKYNCRLKRESNPNRASRRLTTWPPPQSLLHNNYVYIMGNVHHSIWGCSFFHRFLKNIIGPDCLDHGMNYFLNNL